MLVYWGYLTDLKACYCPARCRDVAPSSAADLVAENAADHCAGDCAADVGTAAAFDFLTFHPAALFGRSNHRAHRGNGNVIHAFVAAPPVLIALRDVVSILIALRDVVSIAALVVVADRVQDQALARQ